MHFFSTAWGPRCTVWSIPFGAEEGIWKTPARAEKIRSAKSRRLCTWDFFLSFFFFLLLIVDSVGVQLLTATYKHCCRILLSLLQVLGLLCCNFRASVFVYPIIDLILVLNFQQVAIVGTDLADFYVWSCKKQAAEAKLGCKLIVYYSLFLTKENKHTNSYRLGPL